LSEKARVSNERNKRLLCRLIRLNKTHVQKVTERSKGKTEQPAFSSD